MRQSKTIFIIIILFFTTMINYAQDIFIQGGGTLKDWAHLKKFEKENETLKKVNDSERVVFMGNSITEGWSSFNKDLDHYIGYPFYNIEDSGKWTEDKWIDSEDSHPGPKGAEYIAGLFSND